MSIKLLYDCMIKLKVTVKVFLSKQASKRAMTLFLFRKRYYLAITETVSVDGMSLNDRFCFYTKYKLSFRNQKKILISFFVKIVGGADIYNIPLEVNGRGALSLRKQ